MARFVYPAKFGQQVALFKSIKQKHDDDGMASVLLIFLSSNNININNEDVDADAASVHHAAFENFSKTAEALREERDYKMKLPWKHLKGSAQFLKALYAENARMLGEWSITVNNKNRLVYPKKFSERIALLKNFIAKHNSFAPGTSPLQIFLLQNEIDFTNDLANVNAAESLDDRFDSASRNKESEREQRDVLWKPVMKNVRGMGSYLKSIFNTNPHQAGDYGITVDGSRRKPRLRRTVLVSGKSITIKGIALGSVFTNLGKDVLHLRKAHKKSAEPIIVSPQEQFKIAKGYTNVVVFNPSDAEKGVFSSFFHK